MNVKNDKIQTLPVLPMKNTAQLPYLVTPSANTMRALGTMPTARRNCTETRRIVSAIARPALFTVTRTTPSLLFLGETGMAYTNGGKFNFAPGSRRRKSVSSLKRATSG